MLSFEKFNAHLQDIVESEKWMNEVYNLLDGGNALLEKTAIATAVSLLEDLMEDDDEWIAYWLYDQEFGQKWDEGTASMPDGTPILCRTPRELYDFLVNDYETREADHGQEKV